MEDLWKIRLKKQMTVSQLSSRAGIPARRIRDYETGTRAIPMGDMEKIAKALYVDVLEIEPLSSPIPANLREPTHASGAEQRERSERPAYAGRSGPPARSGSRAPRPPAPARESQIEHLMSLAKLFEWSKADLEKEIGKPLAQLDRLEASQWLKTLQDRVVAERPRRVKKRRPYLPESVDTFELRYLEEKQEEEANMTFALFNGERYTGRIIGFGPYNVTIDAEEEVTLNKLAIAYYFPVAEEGE